MSENGKSGDTHYDRFLSLVGRTRKARTEPIPTPTPSEADIRLAALLPWVSQAPCSDTFLPWLDMLAAQARQNAHLSIQNHAEVVKWLGVEEGVIAVLDEILRISKFSGQTPR